MGPKESVMQEGLSTEEVLHVAALARVAVTPEELERLRRQLNLILETFQVLGEVDTKDVPPTSFAIDIHSVMREDEPRPSFPREDVLQNAPRQEDGFIRVKAVLE
jgi:aspartyl-tRNA(Asn)/glutamyl-tRNA(Gln) amidotransferase subunit C